MYVILGILYELKDILLYVFNLSWDKERFLIVILNRELLWSNLFYCLMKLLGLWLNWFLVKRCVILFIFL